MTVSSYSLTSVALFAVVGAIVRVSGLSLQVAKVTDETPVVLTELAFVKTNYSSTNWPVSAHPLP